MADGIRVESHLPERRKRSTVLAVHGSCCCCCLHTVGGVAGAIYGSINRGGPALPEDGGPVPQMTAEIHGARRFAVKVYWMSLALVTLLATILTTIFNPREPAVAIILIAIYLPGAQFVASVAALMVILARPPIRRSECLARLGRISLFGFLGAVAGIVGLVITGISMGMLR